MSIKKMHFGFTKDKEEVTKYIINNNNGLEVHFIDYGANITNLFMPDKDGNIDDIVLGYDTVPGYEGNGPGYGSFIGRNANRIEGGAFELNGVTYELEQNDGKNNLHGGSPGYNRLMYQVSTFSEEDRDSIMFYRTSPHLEQGFPGNFQVKVLYSVTKDNQLIIQYNGVSDQDTVVNLTNHSYFNLKGHSSGEILDHKVWIKSDFFTPTDEDLIPTGEMADVTNTPMDFRKAKQVYQEIGADYEPLKFADGYDHNYVLDKETSGVEKIASVEEETTKRKMDIYTDAPGLQLYTGNSIVEEEGKDGVTYNKRHGICFETQNYPNAINTSSFPSSVLIAGENYYTKTIYEFLVLS